MATTKRTISPELHEEYSAKLEALLDEQDELSTKKALITKALKGELQIVARQIGHARRVLKGTEGEQEQIPGTELGERRRDPAVESILAAAARVRDASAGMKVTVRVGGKTAEERAKEAERKGLEKDADGILKNAGAGDLVKGELRGPAEKYSPKKGGRR